MSGIERIAREQERQRAVEGYTLEHDRDHVGGELARAAAFYALPSRLRTGLMWIWPWNREYPGFGYKPSPGDRVRELVKAGALIASEIDRLEER